MGFVKRAKGILEDKASMVNAQYPDIGTCVLLEKSFLLSEKGISRIS